MKILKRISILITLVIMLLLVILSNEMNVRAWVRS